MVDDTRLKLAAACRLCGRHSPPYPHGGAVLNVLRTRSQVRAGLFADRKKPVELKLYGTLWWTIQDSNLRRPAAYAAGIRRRIRTAAPCSTCFARGHKFERVCSQIEKTRRTEALRDFVVDDTRLELVTSRTSSGCATSCANRPLA